MRPAYGAGPAHLLAMLLCLGVGGYAVVELGWSALWNEDTWWQSIAVWFVGAVVVHDLVLFPAYAAVDRLLVRTARSRAPGQPDADSVPALNHIRTPLLAIGLLTLMFFPGIIRQGSSSYQAATGQTQDPFLFRWLVLCGVILAVSGFLYAVRVARVRRRRGRPGSQRSRADGLGAPDLGHLREDDEVAGVRADASNEAVCGCRRRRRSPVEPSLVPGRTVAGAGSSRR